MMGKLKITTVRKQPVSGNFYYMIKIQNWGDMDAENVVVSDELDEFLEGSSSESVEIKIRQK